MPTHLVCELVSPFCCFEMRLLASVPCTANDVACASLPDRSAIMITGLACSGWEIMHMAVSHLLGSQDVI